jgi:tripeptidyl-peptidase-1
LWGIVSCSGDSGVGGQTSNCKRFVPTFPATSPWVTGVGATNAAGDAAAYFSGGGFSDYFEQ